MIQLNTILILTILLLTKPAFYAFTSGDKKRSPPRLSRAGHLLMLIISRFIPCAEYFFCYDAAASI